MKSRRDYSFPTDGHRTILNRIINSQTHKKRANIDNKSKPQQKHGRGTVSKKFIWGGGGVNRFYEYSTLALSSAVVHIHLQVVQSGLIVSVTDHCQGELIVYQWSIMVRRP